MVQAENIKALNSVTPALTAVKNIPIEAIIELKLKGNADQDIATLLGCTHQNISTRLSEYKKSIEGIETYKKNRADVLAVVQSRVLNALSASDIKKASMQQKVTSFGILYDKERLERDLSSINVQPMVSFSKPIDITPETDAPECPTSDVQAPGKGKV